MEKYIGLLQEAKSVCENAYAPYSNFKVGAVVLYENDKKYIGANVENASYGLAICAERVAITSAISSGEKTRIKAVAIYSPNQKLCVPCGACRQFISEFIDKPQDVKIILEDENEEVKVFTFEEIFPLSFKIDD